MSAAPPFASSVPPGVVVPLGKVPFRTMVLVPLMSATLTSEKFSLEYVPSPISESRNVVLPLSSQPHSAYAAQRHVTGLVWLTPSSSRSQRARRPFVGLLVGVLVGLLVGLLLLLLAVLVPVVSLAVADRLWNVYGLWYGYEYAP